MARIDQAPTREELVPLGAEAWADAWPFPDAGGSGTEKESDRSFVSFSETSNTIRVRYFKHLTSNEFRGRAWMGPGTQGPPGHAHGGSQAALLDDAMGGVAWYRGHTVLAAKIEIQFRKPLPIGTLLNVRAEIEKVEGRKIFVRGELRDDENHLYSEGSGLFIVIDPTRFAQP